MSSVLLTVSQATLDLLGLAEPFRWDGLELDRKLRGPRGASRYRFRWPRTTLSCALAEAERLAARADWSAELAYPAASARALAAFIREAQQALREPEVPCL